jgi:[CysO sulfur-carrier protein]-S-L-cysteine hydrolase
MHHTISITAAQLKRLTELSESKQPKESVAFLLGEQSEVTQIVPVHNQDDSEISFFVDPMELIQTYSHAKEIGLEVVGIFHSHPGLPEPSTTDLRYMEINPVVWVIYSSTLKEFKAHVVDDGLKSVAIRTVQNRHTD